MAEPKWQRARIIYTAPDKAHLLGCELWVQIGAPQQRPARHLHTGRRLPLKPRLTTHFSNPGSRSVVFAADILELLARGPEDFAEDVQPQDYETWAAEQRRRHD